MLRIGAPPKDLWWTLLVLGRASNLPTVWSNCLAGWLLGGGGSYGRLLLLCVGATCLYLGGTFWNDAFDVGFDRDYRRARPIPSGAVPEAAVWRWGGILLALGLVLLMLLGNTSGMLALLLLGLIVVYDAVHKIVTFSPLLIAGCRFVLYLVAASASAGGVAGLAIWSGLALGAYVAGLSYFAGKESTRGEVDYWPCLLFVAPVVLAYVVNSDGNLAQCSWLCALFFLWLIRCCRYAFWPRDRNVGRTVAGLLAGIVLVDLLAVLPTPFPGGLVFLLLFAAALLLQRFIPAT